MAMAARSNNARIDEAGQVFYKVRIQQFDGGGITRWPTKRNSYEQVSEELGVVEKFACGDDGKQAAAGVPHSHQHADPFHGIAVPDAGGLSKDGLWLWVRGTLESGGKQRRQPERAVQ